MGFLVYCRRFLIEFFRDWAKLLREQVLVGLVLAAMTLALQIRFGVISRSNVRENLQAVLYPYAIIVGVFVLWHLSRTSWKMYQRVYEELERIKRDAAPPPVPRFRDLVQLSCEVKGSDAHLTLVNSGASDWFAVEAVGVRPRGGPYGEGARLPWLVKWADVPTEHRQIPKGSSASLPLYRIVTADKDRRFVEIRFFSPSDERTAYLSLAEAWTDQDIFIGFSHVTVEIDLRITTRNLDETTGRRITLGFTDDLATVLRKIEVVESSDSETKRGDRQRVLDELADFRTVAVGLLNEQPYGNKFSDWQRREKEWREAVLAVLSSHFPKATRLKFEVLGVFEDPPFAQQAVHRQHNHERAMLTRRLEILEGIIDGR